MVIYYERFSTYYGTSGICTTKLRKGIQNAPIKTKSTVRVQIQPGTCEKVASDLGLGSVCPGTWVSSTSYKWLVTT